MEALWRKSPLSADEIVAEVGPAQGWGEATVKTLINRLLKKKALVSERAEGWPAIGRWSAAPTT